MEMPTIKPNQDAIFDRVPFEKKYAFNSEKSALAVAFEYAKRYYEVRYNQTDCQILALLLDGKTLSGTVACRYQMQEVFKKYTEKTCAVLVELISPQGAFVCQKYFIKELFHFCKQRDILCIVKDSVAGCVRSGALFGFQNYEMTPDLYLLTVGTDSILAFGDCYKRVSIPDINQTVLLTTELQSDVDLMEVQGKGGYFKTYLSRVRNMERIENLGLLFIFTTKKPNKDVVLGCRRLGVDIIDLGRRLAFSLPIDVTKQELDRLIGIFNSVISE